MIASLYTAPGLYDRLFTDRTDDVRFYSRLAEGRDGVLEYGVGTGRVAIPLARNGARVTGIDDAPAMLDALAARASDEAASVQARLRWHLGDGAALRLGERFDLVTVPFNGLAHFTDRVALRGFFASVHAHLAPGGWFAFDVWLPDPALLRGAALEGPRAPDPETRELTTLREEYRYDPLTQLLRARISLTPVDRPEGRRLYTLTQRQYFPQETRALLELHGFDVRWQTTRFTPPPEEVRCATDDLTEETADDDPGEMVAWVCTAR